MSLRFVGVGLLALALLAPIPASAASLAAQAGHGPGCTVIYAAGDRVALGGNNEDGFNPLTRIWFVPGVDGGYGSVWVGYDDLVIQGGMNEVGLFFDALAVREVTVPPKPGKPELTGQSAFVHLMSACDSVACVREFYEETSMPGTWNGQALFGDRFGDSAIIEPLAIIPKEGTFQVATNFFQSEVPPSERTDARYLMATSMLDEADALSPELMRDVLEAVQQQGSVNTLYSTVYDLRAQTIDLYYFMDFHEKVSFDLHDELAKGIHGYEIPTLFEPDPAADAVAAPIRSRVAAALARLPEAAVAPEDLEPLVGTYEVGPSESFEVTTGGGVLLGRRPVTPWVPLRALSSTTFAHVYSDATGAVLENRLAFDPGDGGRTATVEITDASGNRAVGTRTTPPAASTDSGPILIGTAVLALAVGVGVLLATSGRRMRPTAQPR